MGTVWTEVVSSSTVTDWFVTSQYLVHGKNVLKMIRLGEKLWMMILHFEINQVLVKKKG